jgi:hypothetical protein
MWLGCGAIVIGLIFYNLRKSPEWRDFSWPRLWASLVGARLGLLLCALALTCFGYLVRAYRWRLFLEPIKRASLWVLFVGQILGFSSIYLIGRPGEFVRPAYIAKKENIPISTMAAVWLLERVFDMIATVMLLVAGLYSGAVSLSTPRRESVLTTMHRGGDMLFALMGLLVVALVLFRLHVDKLTAWVLRAFYFLPAPALRTFGRFLRAFAEGLGVIRSWTGLLASVGATVVLWVLNVTIFWLVFKSLGGGLARLPWVAAGLTLFCAALGLVVQFPGIGGGYQVGIILALTGIFDVAAEPATGAGILIWIMISFPCLALGLVLLVREGLSFRKLEALAEEERAASLQKV